MEEKEEIKHNINRGNGVANDALADIGDLLVDSIKKIKKLEESNSENFILQKKSFNWLKISVFVALVSVILAIISLFF
jgi:hypothetical protein